MRTVLVIAALACASAPAATAGEKIERRSLPSAA